MKCDAGIHEETCTHVVLSGDTTMFPGFSERLVLHGILLPTWVLGLQIIWIPYDAAVKDVSVRTQSCKALTAVYAVCHDERRESHDSIEH